MEKNNIPVCDLTAKNNPDDNEIHYSIKGERTR